MRCAQAPVFERRADLRGKAKTHVAVAERFCWRGSSCGDRRECRRTRAGRQRQCGGRKQLHLGPAARTARVEAESAAKSIGVVADEGLARDADGGPGALRNRRRVAQLFVSDAPWRSQPRCPEAPRSNRRGASGRRWSCTRRAPGIRDDAIARRRALVARTDNPCEVKSPATGATMPAVARKTRRERVFDSRLRNSKIEVADRNSSGNANAAREVGSRGARIIWSWPTSTAVRSPSIRAYATSSARQPHHLSGLKSRNATEEVHRDDGVGPERSRWRSHRPSARCASVEDALVVPA